LADLPFPTVAAINGSCLGGGTELALACDYRIITDDSRSFLGLPETQLGIIPGFGGTQRLPRLVGLPEALRIITTGARVFPRQAKKIGLVDEVVPPEHLLAAARRRVRLNPRPAGVSHANFLDRLAPWRKLVLARARQMARAKTGGHYPAIPAAIEAIEASFQADPAAGLAVEARLVGEMSVTATARRLQQVFRLRERFSRNDAGTGQRFKRLAVVGAGVMGGGIVTLLAERGLQVRLLNRSVKGLEEALGTFHNSLKIRRKKGLDTPRQSAWLRSRLSYATGLSGLRAQEAVIEAVAENLGVKKAVLADISREVPTETLILSNTSSLSISEMARAVVNPGRVAGLHFFNPVERMPLVEVVSGAETTPETRMAVTDLALQLGKIPIPVKDRPGFLVNRLLLPYLNEAARLLEEGGDLQAIDRAMREFGLPLGPFALLDMVGLDIAGDVARTLHQSFGARMAPSPLLARMNESGWLGRKSGRGFYLYDRDQKGRFVPEIYSALQLQPPGGKEPDPAAIVDRLLFTMLNEAARCLAEEVVAEAAAVDAALIFGAGFPPYTGGLLRYADDRGLPAVVAKLEALAQKLGERYAPAELLRSLAAAGGKFYGG
jgi:3-hydroxyacyl-CoA dehydrogenase/enoyl-CoA hydratase/3-hydroxybutyryl-CoA epimerase